MEKISITKINMGDDAVITVDNIIRMGEVFALCSLKYRITRSDFNFRRLYQGLIHDIYRKKDNLDPYTDGYDIAVKAAALGKFFRTPPHSLYTYLHVLHLSVIHSPSITIYNGQDRDFLRIIITATVNNASIATALEPPKPAMQDAESSVVAMRVKDTIASYNAPYTAFTSR